MERQSWLSPAAAFAGKWRVLFVRGILAVLFGVYAFIYPGTTAVVLLYIIAAWQLRD